MKIALAVVCLLCSLTAWGQQQGISALDDLIHSAEQGNADAQFALGVMYIDGRGVPKDDATAMKWFGLAAEQGLVMAMSRLGKHYKAEGHYSSAAEWFSKAANRGDTTGTSDLRSMKIQLRVKAFFNDSDAQLQLGELYARGWGVEQDYPTAATWFEQAARSGDALSFLAFLYAEGKGVTQSDKQAIRWYRAAADQGLPDAQWMLGRRLLDGEGVSQNNVQGVMWLRKAAEQDYDAAQYSLGLRYLTGHGVPQDYAEARRWLLKCEKNVDALEALGEIYEIGLGVERDYGTAFNYYRQAAEMGNVHAQHRLGKMYMVGKGAKTDHTSGHIWLNLAASGLSGGESDGGFIEPGEWNEMSRGELRSAYFEARQLAAKKLTTKELAEAQRLAREWKPKTWEELKDQ